MNLLLLYLNAGCLAHGILFSFPDELLLKIFSYLGPQDLLLSTRVCSRWNGLANDK